MLVGALINEDVSRLYVPVPFAATVPSVLIFPLDTPAIKIVSPIFKAILGVIEVTVSIVPEAVPAAFVILPVNAVAPIEPVKFAPLVAPVGEK